MNEARKAVEDGTGRQFIDGLIREQKLLGLSDRKSVFEVLGLLDLYCQEDERVALDLIRHLRCWIRDNAARVPSDGISS